MKCWYCGIYDATIKDYRTFNGVTGSSASCKWCFNLNNKTIREIQKKKLDPKKFFKEKTE